MPYDRTLIDRYEKRLEELKQHSKSNDWTGRRAAICLKELEKMSLKEKLESFKQWENDGSVK